MEKAGKEGGEMRPVNSRAASDEVRDTGESVGELTGSTGERKSGGRVGSRYESRRQLE